MSRYNIYYGTKIAKISRSPPPPPPPSLSLPPSKDTRWVIYIRFLAHEEGVCAKKLRYQNGHQRPMVITKLLQTPA